MRFRAGVEMWKMRWDEKCSPGGWIDNFARITRHFLSLAWVGRFFFFVEECLDKGGTAVRILISTFRSFGIPMG